ncbi:MAG: hypothetical protein H7A38_01380 [Chlamydiales bacterium]|nr:hypothetical protein [Chlamydiales bacterium]
MTVKLKNTLSPPIPYTDEITRSIWRSSLKTHEHHQFFQRMVLETLQALQSRSYTAFDGQTTSNCCHGLSVLVRRLILTLLPEIDHLTYLVNEASSHELIDLLPTALIDLTSVYVLALIIDLDPKRGRRTSPQKLKSKGSVGIGFCRLLVKRLQKTVSVFVAENYRNIGAFHEGMPWISNTRLQDWSKYLKETHIRTDKRGVKYASALFSMQACLHYLSTINATIALVCDLIEPSNMIVMGRYVRLFRSSESNFIPVDCELNCELDEPIFVLGGYSLNENLTMKQLEIRLEPWIYQLPALVLACDLHYPEFPEVRDDPEFDSSRIQPSESAILEIFEKLKGIPGFSASDPSMFCLSHIFLSNRESLVHAYNNPRSGNIPNCYLPSPSVMGAQT